MAVDTSRQREFRCGMSVDTLRLNIPFYMECLLVSTQREFRCGMSVDTLRLNIPFYMECL